MNPSPLSPAREAPIQAGCWLLEIVRGRDVGRAFALEPGETVVGNALHGQRGLDLREQEGSSPRRMAACHASILWSSQDISIRDLESPGGTFVNQQRLLSGQARKLSAGDVIQLGGVQLRVKQGSQTGASDQRAGSDARAVQASSVAAGGKLPTPFVMGNGSQCRTWDDFLILSAQSWTYVRDELISGRLVEYLRRIGRPELISHSAANQSPDDRLDEWLGRIPAVQSSAPELDVHPETLLVQAKMGGGVARLSLRITNVGFRLLRSSLRIEPADARWVRLLAGGDGKAFQTIDQTEIPVELVLPEAIDGGLRAVIVIESNGGTRRVEARIERPAEPMPEADPAAGAAVLEMPMLAKQLRKRLAGVSPLVRAAACGGGAAGFRLLLVLLSALWPGRGAGSLAEPRIASVALMTVGLGVLSGLILAKRRGEARDLLTGGVAGGMLGLLSSAPLFSLLESAERVLGSWSASIVAVCLLWGAAGVVVALVSRLLIPHHRHERQECP
jgi:hypothetical protein